MLTDTDTSDIDATVESTASLAVTLAWAAGAVVAAYVLATVVSVVVRMLGRRNPLLRDLSVHVRRPMRAVLVVVALWLAVRFSAHTGEPWYPVVSHALVIMTIVALAWLVGAMVFVVEDRVLDRYSTDRVDDRHARRVRTQVTLLRRITVAVLVVCAIAAVLLTFPGARTAGASLLASAGLVSIVAGLAAQSTLANTFAGMQIAFTDAIRVDDVVVLDGEFGRIEEITLTYVVVHVWDDRRLILPCTYFTTTPFENWTRRAADLLGTVEIDLDFRVPFERLRAELDRLLEETSLWDRRTGVLQVTDATDGHVRVRALVSARDAPTLWDLRCYVREGLVDWLQREAPDALPRTRLEGPAADALAEIEGEPGPEAEPETEAGPETAAGERGTTTAPRRGRGAAAAPALVPERAPVRDRSLPAPVRSSVRAASPADPTILLGTVEPAPADATRVLSPEEAERVRRHGAEASALFSGSAAAEARAERFHGPGREAIEEREQTAERNLGHTGEIPAGELRRPRGVAPDSGEGGPTRGPGEADGDGDG
ncbi:mechanosensitive ion channel family protein [Isoptericola variabilis]|uniref:MscS Mechanosensitive ion channel n=1 Tax=Isoptericola variabilis (strain 225) TaxID=743718 RepID=F6FTG3_ISOV2|nr:mechanosensitive ion channel family protein [Isoptericola variabilis]AEG43156.1 MscS Mechanosensitive ion channel [Isoptericola variabilis 225]TWH35087.1 small-conductance mechanosensitive channel [Isoptericola variabilis J7]